MDPFLDQRLAMVDRLARREAIGGQVLDAMAAVPRERFVPAPVRAHAYDDCPLPIGGGQTISQPLVVALMADAAEIGPQARALEVGAGSGYAAAVIGLLAAHVVAIERDPQLARGATERLAALGYRNVEVVCGDGALGYPDAAPFDAIIVSAAPRTVPPALKDQLAVGGRLVVPVGGQWSGQDLLKITRTGPETFSEQSLGGVRFVPLIEG